MKIIVARSLKIFITVMVFCTTEAAAAYPDLTGSDAKRLKSCLGKVVSLRGSLSCKPMQGTCLMEIGLEGALTQRVEFFIIPDKDYAEYNSWEKLLGSGVRVTGKLRFEPVASRPIHLVRGLGDIPQKEYFSMIFHPFPRRIIYMGWDSLGDFQRNYFYMDMGKTKLEVIKHPNEESAR